MVLWLSISMPNSLLNVYIQICLFLLAICIIQAISVLFLFCSTSYIFPQPGRTKMPFSPVLSVKYD